MKLTKSQDYETQVVKKDNGYTYLRVVENGVGLSPQWFSLILCSFMQLTDNYAEKMELHYQNSLKELEKNVTED